MDLQVTTDIVAAATELYRYNYVYLITNLVNGKIYVGKHSTNNPMYGVHRFGKDCPAYGVKQKKYKYVSPDGVVKEMRKSTANRYYKDWRLLDD